MTKKIDFIIYYEHISREWNSVHRLKSELNKLGLVGVIFPKHFYKYISIALFKPKIVILPYLYSSKNDQHLMFERVYGDIPVINLHSEQLHDETTKRFQLPHDEYSASSFHVAWGEKFAKALVEYGVDKTLIYKTGSIRNDDSQIISTNVKRHNNTRKKVLIPTAFSKTFVSEVYIKKLTSLDTIDTEQYLKKLEFTRSVRDEYFKAFYKLASLNPAVLFSFRPHPYVEIKDYINAFKMINEISELPENVLVERNGSIQDEILSSDKIVTWYSSTAIDGHMLGKEVMIFEPVKVPDYMKIDFLEFFPTATTLNDLVVYLDDGVPESSKEKINNYIKYVYGDVDGRSAERLALAIDEIIKSHNAEQISLNLVSYLTNLLKCFYIDLPKLLLMKLGLLDKVKPFYKGVCEDKKVNLSSNDHLVEKSKDPLFCSRLTSTGFEFVSK